MTTLVIDESGDESDGRHRYVVGAGVLVADEGALRASLLALVANRARTVPLGG